MLAAAAGMARLVSQLFFLRVKKTDSACKTALPLPRPTAAPTAALALPRHHCCSHCHLAACFNTPQCHAVAGPSCSHRIRDNCTLNSKGATCAADAPPFRAHQACRQEGGGGGKSSGAKPSGGKSTVSTAKPAGGSSHPLLWFFICFLLVGGFYGLWYKGMLPAACTEKLPKRGKTGVGPQANLYDDAERDGGSAAESQAKF